MQYTECAAVARITGSAPSFAFGYHETGGSLPPQANISLTCPRASLRAATANGRKGAGRSNSHSP